MLFYILNHDLDEITDCISKQDEIKNHEFFKTIDWQLLYDKKIDPPYNPNVVSFPAFLVCRLFTLYLNTKSQMKGVQAGADLERGGQKIIWQGRDIAT